MGTRKGAVSRYHRSKYAGEEAVRASGLDWTIFRPSTIFGPGDSFINMFAGMMRKFPVFPLIGGGNNKMQPVFVKDVAVSYRTALESDVHIGRTYELGGPDVLTLKQILEIAAQVLELKELFIKVPLILVSPVVNIAQLLKIKLPVTSDQLIMLKEDNIRTGGGPVEELGINWIPLEEGLRQYLGPSPRPGA
jgi:NADH dehydrogenase